MNRSKPTHAAPRKPGNDHPQRTNADRRARVDLRARHDGERRIPGTPPASWTAIEVLSDHAVEDVREARRTAESATPAARVETRAIIEPRIGHAIVVQASILGDRMCGRIELRSQQRQLDLRINRKQLRDLAEAVSALEAEIAAHEMSTRTPRASEANPEKRKR